MEQEDYLLREIEKIGLIFRAIRLKLFGGTESFAISIDKQAEEAREMLLTELNFDLDEFLLLNAEETGKYLNNIKGFNTGNIEQLADCLSLIGFNGKSGGSGRYLEKALQLYELIDLKSRTYSMDRESKIIAIKNALKQ